MGLEEIYKQFEERGYKVYLRNDIIKLKKVIDDESTESIEFDIEERKAWKIKIVNNDICPLPLTFKEIELINELRKALDL